MEFDGLSGSDSEAGTVAAGEVLPVMWREPLSEQLIYSLASSPTAMEAVSLPPPHPRPILRSDRASLDLDAWQAAWDAVWNSYAAWEPDAPEGGAAASTHPLPGELVRIATGGLDFLDEAFTEWGLQLATGTVTGLISSEVGQATARARVLGLRGIFVLPLRGVWSRVEQHRILLVSQELADAPGLFASTVNSFGGSSGAR